MQAGASRHSGAAPEATSRRPVNWGHVLPRYFALPECAPP